MKPAKRAKLSNEPFSSCGSVTLRTSEITQDGVIFYLNDDCFEAIFRWLSAEELSRLSATCARIWNLVKYYFRRRYPNKRCEIVEINGIPAVRKYAAICDVLQVVSFHGIPKFYVNRPFYANLLIFDNNLLSYYLHSPCNKLPKCIRFEQITLSHKEGEILSDVLECVESIELINCRLQSTYGSLLAHCKRLKNLTVRSCNTIDEQNYATDTEDWLSKSYPVLESIDIQLRASSDYSELANFLLLNPKIKRFSCRSRLTTNQCSLNNVLTSNIENAKQLENLFLTIGECNFTDMFVRLTKMCERPNFKTLSLEFNGTDVKDILIDNFSTLAELKQLQTLHITNVNFVRDLPDNVNPLVHLAELHLNQLANCNFSAKNISMLVPNLERLIVRDSCYFTPSVVDFIQPFVADLPKLNKIVVAHGAWANVNYRLADLNEQRQKLEDACMVFIWLNPPNGNVKEGVNIVGKTLIRLLKLTDTYEHF